MNVNTICVCGAGTMGRGIAQAAAQAGIPVVLYEPNADVLQKAKDAIDANLYMLAEKKKISAAESAAVLERMVFTGTIEECHAPFIIEAIVEKPEIKMQLFDDLGKRNGPETIFATNTSSLSVSAMAEKSRDSSRLIGMHFFNPATIMKLVEVVRTSFTDPEVVEQTMALARKMGKTPVLCQDAPGFIVNRVARPYYLEGLRLLEQGAATIEQIDTIMEASGFRMGPFRLMDLIGNDVNYAVSCSVYDQLNAPSRLEPSSIQKQKVEEGKLGRKTGEGYYNYQSPNKS